MAIDLDRPLLDRIEALLGQQILETRTPNGGFSPAIRRICRTADQSVFVKVGINPFTVAALNRELEIYAAMALPNMARFIAGESHATHPILILEDLSRYTWPPPWPDGGLDRVVKAINVLHATPPPPGVFEPEDIDETYFGWRHIAANPAQFLATGAGSRAWLDDALPTLLAAEARCTLTGDALLHMDLRSDNLCLDGDRVLFVDWNWAVLGSARLDLGFFLNTVTGEGGPRQEIHLPDAGDEAAVIAGVFGYLMGLPGIPDAPLVRAKQREQFEAAIAWTARALNVPALQLPRP